MDDQFVDMEIYLKQMLAQGSQIQTGNDQGQPTGMFDLVFQTQNRQSDQEQRNRSIEFDGSDPRQWLQQEAATGKPPQNSRDPDGH